MQSYKYTYRCLCVALLGLALSSQAGATAIANSDIHLTNLQISPLSGTVQLLDNWNVEAFTEALNSLGDYDAHYDSNYPGGSASTDATVPMAGGHGDANSADFPAPPDLSVTADALSFANVPGSGSNSAQSSGRGTFSNTFMVTGGTGSVSVDFAGTIQGILDVFADNFGLLAETEAIFSMEVFGLPETTAGPQDSLVLFSFKHLLIGPNDEIHNPFLETLTGFAVLDYDTHYSFLIQVDSESRAAVAAPEPAMPLLLMAGATLWLTRKRNRYDAAYERGISPN